MSVREITTGQDSFLDIVANLVGVLIILVVVVGAQAKVAIRSPEPVDDHSAEIETLQSELDQSARHAKKMEADNENLEMNIQQEVTVNLGLSEYRHQMLVQIQIVEQQLAKKKLAQKQQMTAQQAAEFDRLEEQRKLEIELAQVKAETTAVAAASTPKSEIIEHYPNPIAKTVFAEEVHFQLRGGKLAYVPLEELVTRMKAEWKMAAEKLQHSDRTIETVGPIQNFRLQYELESETRTQATSRGVVEQRAIRFDGFTLFPSSEDLGVSVEQSLRGQSEFMDVLRRYPTGKTTVSLWIYPDSYTEYNQLKKWLYENGYQIACWPLDADKRISGGPNGFRTSAQ